jgi:hypothetical protein
MRIMASAIQGLVAAECKGGEFGWPAHRPHTVFPAANPTQPRPWTGIDSNDRDPDHGFSNLQMVVSWNDVDSSSTSGRPAVPATIHPDREKQEASADFSARV